MRVGLGRLAVRRPAGVADADRARQRRGGELRLEVLEFSLGAPAREHAMFERGDAGQVVAAIFQALQRVDDGARHGPRPENADNSAHPSPHSEANSSEASVRPTSGAITSRLGGRNDRRPDSLRGRVTPGGITWAA